MAQGFYVTLRRETRQGVKTAWLLGPFGTHDEALECVTAAAKKAEEIDPRCFWDAHGTSSITREGAALADLPKGVINHLMGM